MRRCCTPCVVPGTVCVQRASLLRSPTFRVALLYGTVFAVTSAALVIFIYDATVGSLSREIDSTLSAQVSGLADVYARDGLGGLVQVLHDRVGAPSDRQAIYLLEDEFGHVLVGNLTGWPGVPRAHATSVEFEVDALNYDVAERHVVRARMFRVAGGQWLLVGRDIQQLVEFERRALSALGWALAATLGIGIPGGLLLSRSLLRRVETINSISRRIAEGHLSQRLPVRTPGDEIDRLAVHLNDMLNRIEQLMLGMRTVTDSIAHDLRAPLTRLKGRVELALAGPPDAERYRSALTHALRETDRLVTMFEALISIAQAESGALATEFERLDLSELAVELCDLYTPAAEDAGQTLACNSRGPVVVWGKPQLLAQTLANLIDNAVNYSGRGSHIVVDVSSSAEYAELSVADTGPGIDAADRDRALERFSRLASSEGVHGSGLGLSLAAAVARLHRGTLALSDNSPGLRVTVRLPRPDSDVSAPGA